MNICESLCATSRLFPDDIAIFFEGQQIQYSELDRLSARAAKLLGESGVQVGDRVAMMLPNVPAFAVWYYATLRIGAIAVSVSTRLTNDEVAFVLSDCEAKTLVVASKAGHPDSIHPSDTETRVLQASDLGDLCDSNPLPELNDDVTSWFDAAPDDPALILYTSGTTGFPKGATLSHRNVRSNVAAFNHLCDMQSDDRILLAVPLFHCFGQNALLNSALNVGATIVLQRQFDPKHVVDLIREQCVTQLYGVPTMFQIFHDLCSCEDLAGIRYCFSAAAKLPTTISDKWLSKFGQPIFEGYGLTETSPFASYNHQLKYKMGSIGTPIDSVEMQVFDTQTRQRLPSGELGEIGIRGPNVMLGYWNRPDETEAAIQDGWFYSGDIGRVDRDGFFYIVDRLKDMIVIGGLKVYPAEVERTLNEHPAVCDSAVVGLSNDVTGETVVAFLVLSDDMAADREQEALGAIKRFAKEKLASYKAPSRFMLVKELPRNPSGKVLKKQLRALAEEHKTSTEAALDEADRPAPAGAENGMTGPRDDQHPRSLRSQLQQTFRSERPRIATEYIQSVICQLTSSETKPAAELTFLDAGLDSLMIVELSQQLQTELGSQRELPATLVFDYPRITDLAGFLVAQLVPDDDRQPSPSDANHQAKPLEAEDVGGANKNQATRLQRQVANMSEEEALAELLRELKQE